MTGGLLGDKGAAVLSMQGRGEADMVVALREAGDAGWLDIGAVAAPVRSRQARIRSLAPAAPAAEEAAEELRCWIARELHDSVVQSMTTMLVQLEEWRRQEASADVRARLVEQQTQLREALLGLRGIVHGLRRESAEAELTGAIRTLLARLEGRTGIETRLVIGEAWSDDLPAAVSLHLRRIVEEALTNAVKHSGAAHVEVRLTRSAGRLDIVVRDDGRGRVRAAGAAAAGLGIRGMRERALLIGARLQLRNGRRQGTVVRVCLPLYRTSAA